MLLEAYPRRGGGCIRGGGGRLIRMWLQWLRKDAIGVLPNWDSGCEGEHKGKWVEEPVRIRSLGGSW